MSYDIYFIKGKNITDSNIDHFLESEVSSSDEHFISKELMIDIKKAIEKLGLKFELFQNENDIELDFPTYQVSMFNSQIAISLPYWDSNSSEGINKEVKQISNLLFDMGFSGYDPQTGELFNERYEMKKQFTESKTVVDKMLNNDIQKNNNNTTYIGIGIGIILLAIIIWKFVFK